MKLIRWNGREIELDYSSRGHINGTSVGVRVEKEIADLGEEYEQAYRTAEEEVICYLIKKALEKREEQGRQLRRIGGIKKSVCLSPVNGYFILEIALGGIAV